MNDVTLVRQMAASIETVFAAVTTAEGIARWWGPDDGPVLVSESDPREGGHYRLRFRMKNGDEHEAGGTFLAVEPPHRVSMSFRWADSADDSAPSRIDMSLRAVDGGTELTFVHADLPDPETARGHRRGWEGSLAKLQRSLGPTDR
jgi:uncharacterized protein YndB with AHSA1/START domain